MKRITWLLAGALALTSTTVGAPTAAAQSAEDEEGALLVEEARRAIGKRDYARAGKLLDRALRLIPRRIDLYVLRASVHGVRKEHDPAIALLRKAQKLAPDNGDVLAALGIQLVLAGKASEGVPVLERIVERDQRRYDVQVVLGHYYVKQAKWDGAVGAFDAYFASRPSEVAGEDPIHQIDHANAYLRSGAPAKARVVYEKVLAKSPGSELARLGVAWSAAAVDCNDAMPLFAEMEDLEAKYPDVSLVRGRCALMLGSLDAALDAAERYRKAVPAAGDGWALLGDVRTAKKNYAGAETAYARALKAEPDDKLYAFKLGRTERQLGKLAAAADRLRQSGPPLYFEDDWTLEYGEALYGLGEMTELRDHMAPWVEGHGKDATGQFLLGVALYRLGDLPGAIDHLDRAHAGKEPRAAKPLIASLNSVAVASIGSGDLKSADTTLTRAEAIDDDVLTWRNHGAVLLALDDVDRATGVLRKAADKDKKDPAIQHLLARAYQAAKKYDDARTAYGKAIKGFGKGKRAIAAQLDLANNELASGRAEQAVASLEAALDAGPDAETKMTLTKALVSAARAGATEAMRNGKFGSAVRLLKQIEKRVSGEADVVEVRCDLALASTGSSQHEPALEYLRKLEKAKAKCPFVKPADELGVPILIAWNEGATLRKARKALDRLETIRKKASGVAEPLVRLASKDIALRAAQEAYGDGNLKQAAKFLATAKLHDKRSPELAHNLAVIELANGKVDTAIPELERIADEVPEALVNLGIAYDRKHDPLRALEYWKKAVSAGVKHGPLNDWIETKERFWGGSR